MKQQKLMRRATQTLLSMVALIIFLNFACAKGSGVEILNLLGLVPDSEVELREQILRGVLFMQNLIKIVAGLGLLISLQFALQAIYIRKKAAD